jgi:hypothetical protein
MPRALGWNVLVKISKVDKKSAGGIELLDNTVNIENMKCEVGEVVDIGPIAFYGFSGCDPEKYPPSHPRHKMSPAEIYGIKIGDVVEFRRMEGKESAFDGDLRYIPDQLFAGVK